MRGTSDVLEANRQGKSAEAELLRDFLIRLQVKPDSLAAAEQPDFFVSAKGHKVAVELTLFHSDSEERGSPGRKQFEPWAAIAQQLRDRLRQLGINNLYGSVFLKEPGAETMADIDRSQFVEQIAELCRADLNLKPGWNNIINFEEFPYLASLLDQINVYVGQQGKLWWCSHLQAGGIPEPLPIIRGIIQGKVAKAQQYHRADAEELWLVIVARALHLWDSGILNAEHLQNTESITSTPFDRIFFWDKFSENIWCLAPEMKIAMHSGNGTLHINRLPSFWRM